MTNQDPDPEAAGAKYAQDQITGDYFMDWVREQLAEASRMNPEDVLPLETKADAMVIAKNMLQQLKWDTRKSSNWYDLSITVKGDTDFLRRLAGHIEDGKPSTSDPAATKPTLKA